MIGWLTMEKVDNRITNSVGSSRIRAKWVYERWEDAEEYQIGKKYDTLIFQKVYWDNMMEKFNGVKILDLCDPDWLEGKDVMRYCQMVDGVTTSTQSLADYIGKFVDTPVKFIPDRVALEEHKPIKKEHNYQVRSAVWFGYSHNAHYLMNTLYHLARYNIELTIVSDRGWEPKDPPVTINNRGYSYPGIHEELIKHDIVLLPDPAAKDTKGRFKSDNKVTQSWALGMPVVRYPEDLDRLMDLEERKKESELRLKEVKEKYDVNISVKEYKDFIDEIQKRR